MRSPAVSARAAWGRCTSPRTRRAASSYALKVLLSELGENEEFKRRFERESQYASSLEHPNIVRVHEFGESNGVAYMVMEYVEGRDLTAELADGPLSPERTIADPRAGGERARRRSRHRPLPP